MNVQLPVPLDKQAFLSWAQGREERYELVDGRVVMMVGASRDHARIIRNIMVALSASLGDDWNVIADFGLDAGPRTLRYPDIMVERAGGAGSDYTTDDPVLLIEVLSPSSEALDLGDKAAEYLRLPNLAAYIVFAQREAKAWVYLRAEAGFSAGPVVVAGREETIQVPALSMNLPLADVYRGITLE